jgi:hypothetical protein
MSADYLTNDTEEKHEGDLGLREARSSTSYMRRYTDGRTCNTTIQSCYLLQVLKVDSHRRCKEWE